MKQFIVTTLATLSILLAAVPAARADTSCTGNLTGALNGDINVPDNATCTLTAITVHGNVTVGQNSTLTVNGGTISGDVQGNNCHVVDLYAESGTIGLVVGGNVEIGNCSGPSGISAQFGPVTVGGDFHCHNNTAPCTVAAATIGGNVQITNNVISPPGFGFDDNISLNTIAKNLHCDNNSPPPVPYQGPNTVAGYKRGQCAASLGF